MEDLSTFLELPLHNDLYSPKSKLENNKPPLKVLITEANSKIARNLIYKICSGEVFGSDQEIILHLTYSRGTKDSRTISPEFYLCGFPVLLDVVTSNEPEKIYKNVDLVVAITTFEELSGYPYYTPFLQQVFFTLQVAQNMGKYAKSDSKLVICGPSTKGSIVLLTILKQSNLKIQYANISGVTILDETIAKNVIAARLKTTTTQIKNLVIWGATHADIQNGTVFMYPSEDKGRFKKIQIPLVEALADDNWVQSDLLHTLHARIIPPHFVSHGMAVAAACAMHIKLLFQGSHFHEEIISMGVIVPSDKPYGLSPKVGFSLPVSTENGRITVKENVPLEAYSYLTNLKDEYNLSYGKIKIALDALEFFSLESDNYKRDFDFLEKVFPGRLKLQNTKLQHIVCSMPRFTGEETAGAKLITWESPQQKVKLLPEIKTRKQYFDSSVK